MGRANDLALALNGISAENGSNTPDFILGEFLSGVLDCFDEAVEAREQWYQVHHEAAVWRDKGVYDFSDATAEEAVFQALGAASGVAMRANPQWDFSTASEEFGQIGNALLSRLSVKKEAR